jgi:hypothetical protein
MTGTPHYDLVEVITLVGTRRYRVSSSAQLSAGSLGFDEEDIVACICALTPPDLYKTMEAEAISGLWQDVYRTRYGGYLLYVKVQIQQERDGSMAVVISFKEK